MLHSLHLHNFALSQHSDITFAPGFNVITGETGAGKSLLLDALLLALGGRGSGEMVRFGEKSAEIYAQFSLNADHSGAKNWFAKQDREFDGELMIRRKINQDGRSKAWINGLPASVSELKTLGGLLVHSHSQHAGLELLNPTFALNFLDALGGLTADAVAVKAAYSAWQNLLQQESILANTLSNRLDRITLLQSKLADLEPLAGIDIHAAESAYEELANLEELTQDASLVHQLLSGDSDTPCVQHLLGRAIKLCEKSRPLSESFAHAYHALADCQALIQETAANLQSYSETQNADSGELDRLNRILSTAHRLANKYRTPIDELLQQSDSWIKELAQLESLPDACSLATQIQDAHAHFMALAQALQQKRVKIAPKICTDLVARLVPLALPNAKCQFDFRPQKAAASGLFEVQLLFSANVGMPLLPLHKVASGGELSRLALVMQVMNAKQKTALPLLVFDEVDVGISGGTAQVVGEMLRHLGQHQQVIAITHQAQVAACSQAHILASKDHGTQSTSRFAVINGEAQIYELARMSGGVQITDETLAHAKSLLDAIAR